MYNVFSLKGFLRIVPILCLVVGVFAVAKEETEIKSVKLSPQVRKEVLEQSQWVIPQEKIRPYLQRVNLLTSDEYDKAPYVVAFEGERVLAGRNAKIYVRHAQPFAARTYAIVQKGDTLVKPGTEEKLGYAATIKGTATLVVDGDPATFRVNELYTEIEFDDKLVEYFDYPHYDFKPQRAAASIESQILAVFGGVINIGKGHVVVLLGGRETGLHIGDLLAVYRAGETLNDSYAKNNRDAKVVLPNERAGELMVFKLFNKMSLAVVLNANNVMEVSDKVGNF